MNQGEIDIHVSWYEKRRPLYESLSQKVGDILTEVLESQKVNYHTIQTRTKSIESFKAKLSKSGISKPDDIKDLAGIRIIAYVISDLKMILPILRDLFETENLIVENKSEPLGIDKVGYRSWHLTGTFKSKRLELPEYQKFCGLFFEVQARTILEHAWADLSHDRNYKFTGRLPDSVKRDFNLLAANLESIDYKFEDISNKIAKISDEVGSMTKKGNLKIPINSTSLREYFTQKYADIPNFDLAVSSDLSLQLIDELESMEIKTLEVLDKITPDNFKEALKKISEISGSNIAAAIRIILIAHDYDKYLKDAWKGHFVWVPNQAVTKILEESLQIDMQKVINRISNSP